MTTDTITFKKELLLEQIENYQHSGFFTEKEIDRLCAPIMLELELLECCNAHNILILENQKPVDSFEELKETFFKMVKARKPISKIEVIDAQILTQINPEA